MSLQTYTDNGTNTPNGTHLEFTYTFPVLQTEDVKVALNGVTQATTKYSVSTSPAKITFNNTSVDSSVQAATGAPLTGVLVRVFRETEVYDSNNSKPKASYASGSSIRAQDLNNNQDQTLYAIKELQEQKVVTAKVQSGAITSDKIKDGTIVNADVNASAAIDGTKISPNFGSQNIVTSGTVDGRDVSTDGTKLDGIETGATADQTASEIKALYEDSGNSNASYIKTQYESNSNTNAYTDAEKTKLTGIETGATADQTGAEIKTAYEAESNTNAFTDAEKTKLSGIATGADVTSSNSINALTDVNTAGVADGKILKYDSSSSAFIIADDGGSGSGGSSTFTGLSDTPANFGSAAGKTLKVNSAGNAVEFVSVSGSDLVDDTTPQLGGNLDVQDKELNTSTTNGNIKLTPNGTGKVEVKGNTNAGSIQLNCENNSHGVTIKGPAHSAAANYTLTLPPDDGDANEVLKTDGSGNLDWTTIATDKIEEGNSKAEILDGSGGTGDFKVTLDNNQVLDINPTVTNLGTSSAPNHLYTYGDIRFSIGSGVSPWIRLDSSANLEVTGAYGGGSSIGSVFKFGGYQGTHVSGGNINPSSDSTYDLGSNTVRWQNIYADTLYGDGSNLTNLPASSYNIQINTLSSSSGSGGGSATFNGTATRFTLSNPGTNAQAHIVSVNGVIQKPNSGTSPSEGFAIDGNDIIFASAPASGSDFFILTLGNSIGIGTPSDNTCTAAKIASGAVEQAKVAGEAINESKLQVSNAPTNGYYLQAQSGNAGGMTWAEVEAGAKQDIFWENGQTVSSNYTITNGKNAMSAGPITIDTGISVTIGTGENWTIV